MIYPYNDVFKKYFYARAQMSYIVNVINFLSEKYSDKFLFLELMHIVMPRYIAIIRCFEDKGQIVEEFIALKDSGYCSDDIKYLLDLFFLAEKADTPLDT